MMHGTPISHTTNAFACMRVCWSLTLCVCVRAYVWTRTSVDWAWTLVPKWVVFTMEGSKWNVMFERRERREMKNTPKKAREPKAKSNNNRTNTSAARSLAQSATRFYFSAANSSSIRLHNYNMPWQTYYQHQHQHHRIKNINSLLRHKLTHSLTHSESKPFYSHGKNRHILIIIAFHGLPI